MKNIYIRKSDNRFFEDKELKEKHSLLIKTSDFLSFVARQDIPWMEKYSEKHGELIAKLNSFVTDYLELRNSWNLSQVKSDLGLPESGHGEVLKIKIDYGLEDFSEEDLSESLSDDQNLCIKKAGVYLLDKYNSNTLCLPLTNKFFDDVEKLFKKHTEKKHQKEIRGFVHLCMLKFINYNMNLNFYIVDDTKLGQTEEKEALSEISNLEEGNLAIINGEVVEAINILEGDYTSTKVIVPRRFRERYKAKLEPEEISKLKNRSNTLFGDIAKGSNRYPKLEKYVPQKDNTFLMNRKEYVDWIKMFATPDFSVTLLSGDAGVGKSELVQQVCARMNMPLVRVDFSGEVIAEQILWTQNYNPETKKMEVVEGVIPFCVRNGVKLCLEEFSSIPPSVAFELHRLFEKGSLYIKDNDTLIEPHPNFSIVLTDNRIGNANFQKYFGTQQQNAALISRVNSCVWISYPNKKLEKDYLMLKFPEIDTLKVVNKNSVENSQDLLDVVIDFANDIRPKYERGEISFTISPRDVIAFFKTFYKLEDLNKAFEYSILNFNKGFSADEKAIKEVFNKYFGEKPEVKRDSEIVELEKVDLESMFNTPIVEA